jgi:hypothetical protein
MLAWVIAFAAVYILFGVLIATGVQRSSRARGDTFTSSAFHMMVVGWPVVMIAVLRQPVE